MRTIRPFPALILLPLLPLLTLSTHALDLNTPERQNLPTGIKFPERVREKVFTAGERKANFTAFKGIKDVAVRGGVLSFTLDADTATLGWGNAVEKQPVAEIVSLWQQANTVALEVRQSADTTRWTLMPWRDGEPLRRELRKYKPFTVELKGAGWQTLSFDAPVEIAPPDGLEFTIEGTPGARIEIKQLTASQTVYEGVARHEFTLPEGRIWRAVARVGSKNHRHWYGRSEITSCLYVNGREVERQGAQQLYHTAPADLRPYLKTGRNCVGFQGFRIGYAPPLFFDLTVIMEDGETITVRCGEGWTFSPTVSDGWNQPGFDDSAWTAAEPGGNLWTRVRDFSESLCIPTYTGRLVIKNPNAPRLFYDAAKPIVVNVHIPPGLGDRTPTLTYTLGRADANGVCTPVENGKTTTFSVAASRKGHGSQGRATHPQPLQGGELAANRSSPPGRGQPLHSSPPGRGQGWVSQRSLPSPDPHSAFRIRHSPSLTYRLDLGRHPHGVYVIALALHDADGELIEERTREPLVVLREIEQKVIQATDYHDGLDLELEDTIDFTDPDDPHPWHEFAAQRGHAPFLKVTEPTVVTQDGLTYRQIGNLEYSSGYSYRMEFKHPGSFYLMELDYPDNGHRMVEACVTSKRDGVRFSSETAPGAETGGKFHTTGKMQTLRWIHVADSGPHSIDILNGKAPCPLPAAAAGLRIYRIKGNLPSAGAGTGRHYGIHTERIFYHNGPGRNFGTDRPITKEARRERDQSTPPMQTFLQDLVWLKDTCERYLQYLRFAGQNTHVMGCYQYTDYNTPYVAVPEVDDPRVPWCMRSMMAHVMDLNGVDFFAGLEFTQSQDVRSYVNNAQVARGAETHNLVNARGEQRYATEILSHVPNWLHPDIRARFREVVGDMTRTFGHLSRFRGVHQLFGPSQWGSAYWLPGYGWMHEWDNPFNASFDDITIGMFESETGIALDIDPADPERFSKRAARLAEPDLRDRFLAWRCGKLDEFFADAIATMHQAREDLQWVGIMTIEDSAAFRHFHAADRSFPDILHDFAIDLDALKSMPDFWLGRWTISWRQNNDDPIPPQDPYGWLIKEDPRFIEPFDRDINRYVMCRTSWDENHIRAGGIEKVGHKQKGTSWGALLPGSDWIQNRAELTIMPQPSGVYAREAIIQAIITADPELVLSGFTDVNLNLGHEHAIRSVLVPYSHLPREKFETVLDTGLRTTLAIRKLTQGDTSWFYVANPGYWPISGSIRLLAGAPIEPLFSSSATAAGAAAGETVLPVQLAPYGLAVFRVASPQLEITAYNTEPIAAPYRAFVTDGLARVREFIDDSHIRLVLTESDRAYMDQTLTAAHRAAADGNLALAWSLVKQPRYWVLWKEFLEKAAETHASLPDTVGPRQRSAAPDPLPVLEAQRADGPIAIDGKLDESAWSQAPFATGFWREDAKPSVVETGIKALYDDAHLYLAVACADRYPDQVQAEGRTEEEINPKRDDQIAVFLRPDETKKLYYQMACNAAGVRFDQRVRGGAREYDYAPEWKTATQMGEDYWITEIVLPVAAFDLEGPRKEWRLNVHRRVRGDTLKPSSWSWSPRNWHNLERMGHLRFE